jgi:hypothetical protein
VKKWIEKIFKKEIQTKVTVKVLTKVLANREVVKVREAGMTKKEVVVEVITEVVTEGREVTSIVETETTNMKEVLKSMIKINLTTKAGAGAATKDLNSDQDHRNLSSTSQSTLRRLSPRRSRCTPTSSG